MAVHLNPNGIIDYDKAPIKNLELKEAVGTISEDQKKFLKQLRGFLETIFRKTGDFTTGIDEQNIYLGKREVEIFSDILKKKTITIDSENIGRIIFDVVFDILREYNTTVEKTKKISDSLEKQLAAVCEELKKKIDKEQNESAKKESKQKKASTAKTTASKEKQEIKEFSLKFLNSKIILFKKSLAIKNISDLSKTILHRWNRREKWVTTNLKIFKRNSVNFLDRKVLFGAISDFKAFNDKRKSIEKRLIDQPAAFMKQFRVKAATKIAEITLTTKSWLSVAFGLNIIVPTIKFVKMGISGTISLVKFGLSVVSKALSFAIDSLRKIKNLVVGVLSVANKTLQFALKKTGVWNLFKMTAKLFLGFFQTHTGAYVLGYIAGILWKNMGNLFKFFKNIGKHITDFIDKAKTYLEGTIIGRSLINFSEYVTNMFKDAVGFGTFLAQELGTILFGDTNFATKLKDISDLFTMRDMNGSKIDINLINGMNTLSDIIRDKILNGTFWERSFRQLTNTAVRGATSLVGAQIGSVIGAGLGTLIPIPGATIITGIIGAYVGGQAGRLVGNTLLKIVRADIPFRNVATIESKFNEEMRHAGFLSYDPDFGSVSEIEELSKLQEFARKHSAETKFDEEQLRKELTEAGISERVQAELAFSDAGNLHKQLVFLSNIDKIRYDDIIGEINTNIEDLRTLYEKKDVGVFGMERSPGQIYSNDFAEAAFSSGLTISGDSVKFPPITEYKLYNPLWLKIGRAVKLRDLILQMKSGILTPTDFYKQYEDLENPFSKQYDDVAINYGSEPTSISELIHGETGTINQKNSKYGYLINRLKTDWATAFSALKLNIPDTMGVLWQNKTSFAQYKQNANEIEQIEQRSELTGEDIQKIAETRAKGSSKTTDDLAKETFTAKRGELLVEMLKDEYSGFWFDLLEKHPGKNPSVSVKEFFETLDPDKQIFGSENFAKELVSMKNAIKERDGADSQLYSDLSEIYGRLYESLKRGGEASTVDNLYSVLFGVRLFGEGEEDDSLTGELAVPGKVD